MYTCLYMYDIDTYVYSNKYGVYNTGQYQINMLRIVVPIATRFISVSVNTQYTVQTCTYALYIVSQCIDVHIRHR